MIKIIKEGKAVKFTKICPDCGCEFEYELEDVKTDYSVCLTSYPAKYNTYVVCPCCGKHVHHGYTEPDFPTYPNIMWTTTGTGYQDLDCDKCPNKPDPTKIVVGDTPCTWCKKNQPYCFTGDKFPSDYKGGSYKVSLDQYKNVGYTSTSEYQEENPLIITADDKYEIEKDITINGTSALVRENDIIKVVKRTTTNSKEGNFNRLFITNYERDLFFKSARRGKYYKENKKFAIDKRDEQLYSKWSNFMDKRFINIINEIKENRIKG